MKEFDVEKSKSILLFISLLFATIYIPLSFCVYSPYCYDYNYYLAQDSIDMASYNQATTNLREFFRYSSNLDYEGFNSKEVAHLSEVRTIYDFLLVMFILSLFSLFFTFDKKKVRKYTKYNIYTVLGLLVIIPFFIPVWVLMHSIFFSNLLWMNTPNELSYYIFSDMFFRNIMLFVIVFTIIENGLIRLVINKNKGK